MSPHVRSKANDHTTYAQCPKCAGTDLRGPIDTPPTKPHGHFTRTWFCRTCWWDTSILLFDPAFLRAAAASTSAAPARS